MLPNQEHSDFHISSKNLEFLKAILGKWLTVTDEQTSGLDQNQDSRWWTHAAKSTYFNKADLRLQSLDLGLNRLLAASQIKLLKGQLIYPMTGTDFSLRSHVAEGIDGPQYALDGDLAYIPQAGITHEYLAKIFALDQLHCQLTHRCTITNEFPNRSIQSLVSNASRDSIIYLSTHDGLKYQVELLTNGKLVKSNSEPILIEDMQQFSIPGFPDVLTIQPGKLTANYKDNESQRQLQFPTLGSDYDLTNNVLKGKPMLPWIDKTV